MELERKYIRAYNNEYDVDSVFIEKLHDFNVEYSLNIIQQIKDSIDVLPKMDGYQFFGGVVRFGKPMFFELQFINEIDDIPVLIDVSEISSDHYLDYINKNQSL
jgi:hypothetical protein